MGSDGSPGGAIPAMAESEAEVSSEELVSQQQRGMLGRLLPWGVSLAVVSWLLWPYRDAANRALLFEAFGRASGWTVPVVMLFAAAIWLSDSYATARTFQRWGTPLGLRETALIRGATLLFDAVNPALGQLVLTIVVHRRGTPLRKAIAIVLLMNVIFMVQIALIAGAGLFASTGPDNGVVPVLVGLSVLWVAVYGLLLVLRPAALQRFSTLSWLMDAGPSGHAWAFAYRLPNMAILIASQIALLWCFGIVLPLGVALLYLPVVMFVVGMPISVQGLGPAQMASVAFFSAYVAGSRAEAEATVLACGFAGTALFTLCAMLIGLGCFATRTGRESLSVVRRPAAAPTSES
ncbi:MAG: lysylphosphatidylglycerol synthase domain-containing protein [Myxococcales bacterium]|nr:lysylphosphatidylglycerol synthase domain-containing protein [Myxococcales bacterium]MDD9970850.1 lysylphosphatidylglycerol synthase domain-containing protein [Myxococcales bacterium]